MSVHDACTLYAGGCRRNISSVSPWYPLVGIPIGVYSSHSARLGHPSRLKIDTLARPFCSEEVFAMDILAESRFTFRQGHMIEWGLPGIVSFFLMLALFHDFFVCDCFRTVSVIATFNDCLGCGTSWGRDYKSVVSRPFCGS